MTRLGPPLRWVALVAATAALLAACSSDPSTSPSPSAAPRLRTLAAPSGPGASAPHDLPTCQFPPEVPLPAWLPTDLPLPEDTYASETLPESQGYNRAVFVVPGSLEDLTRFILAEWPAAGWDLGRGESEPGEIETQFSRTPAAGSLRAQANYCEPGFSLMLLTFTPDRGSLGGPSGTTSPSG